jgi:hypothetical protein
MNVEKNNHVDTSESVEDAALSAALDTLADINDLEADEIEAEELEAESSVAETEELEAEGSVADLEASMTGDGDLSDISELDELEDLNEIEDLEELSAEGENVETVDEGTELDESELGALDVRIETAEGYAAQKSEVVATVDTTDGKKVTVKTARPPSSSAGKARVRDMSAVSPEIFWLSGDHMSASEDDVKANRDAVQASIPSQVKVADKFQNMFLSMASGALPSRYTVTAFKALNVGGSVTSADICAAFKSEGLGEGTARSQSGQIMVLFPALGIADRDGKSLKLKPSSNVAKYLTAKIGL